MEELLIEDDNIYTLLGDFTNNPLRPVPLSQTLALAITQLASASPTAEDRKQWELEKETGLKFHFKEGELPSEAGQPTRSIEIEIWPRPPDPAHWELKPDYALVLRGLTFVMRRMRALGEWKGCKLVMFKSGTAAVDGEIRVVKEDG